MAFALQQHPAQRRAFLMVVSAQFFSSLADNALLIAAIGLLLERHAAPWMTPTLRLFFYLSYVLLAAFAGAVADAIPKGRVIFGTNLVKLAGCGLLLLEVHPLLAYALIGLGAAAYSPAKYGILPELLAPEQLVAANAWIEVSTLLSILFGIGLGSFLMAPSTLLPQIAGTPASNATTLIASVYLIALLCAAAIPKSKISNSAALPPLHTLLHDFRRSFVILWRDPDTRVSLAVTTLFWAVSATLQFIILRWGTQTLQLPLAQAALLQVGVALGMMVGAIAAARWIPLRCAQKVLPLGIAIGASVLGLTGVTQLWIAVVLLFIAGALAGLLVVPMNALLQHRGQLLMHSGQSIAVQNFNESLASLVLLAVYGLLLYVDAPLLPTIVGLGLFVSLTMLWITAHYWANRGSRASDTADNAEGMVSAN